MKGWIAPVAPNICWPCTTMTLWTHVLAAHESIVHGSLSSQFIVAQRAASDPDPSGSPASTTETTFPHDINASSRPTLSMLQRYQIELRLSTRDKPRPLGCAIPISATLRATRHACSAGHLQVGHHPSTAHERYSTSPIKEPASPKHHHRRNSPASRVRSILLAPGAVGGALAARLFRTGVAPDSQ